jgi:hypothetical protein
MDAITITTLVSLLQAAGIEIATDPVAVAPVSPAWEAISARGQARAEEHHPAGTRVAARKAFNRALAEWVSVRGLVPNTFKNADGVNPEWNGWAFAEAVRDRTDNRAMRIAQAHELAI